MYTQYFGLSKAPFKITPDPEFFFAGGNRGAVLEALLYAVSRGEGIVKVVGEVGSGKTMLCRMLERELPLDCEIVYLANPRLSADEILHAIAIELELKVEKKASKVEVMRILHSYLLDKHARNRRVVMFIEEAQGMTVETLEEIRMLSNLETTQDKLLQIVLFGQPELNDKLRGHDIRQLKERITYAFDLAPLKRAEIREYLNTRIRASGFRGNDLFSNAAIRTLEHHSEGLLRRINILADKALLAAFAAGDRSVEPVHFRLAAKDSEFHRGFASGPLVLAAGFAAMFGIAIFAFWWNTQERGPMLSAQRAASSAPSEAQTNIQLEYSSPELTEDKSKIALDAGNELLSSATSSDSVDATLGETIDPLLVADLLGLDGLEPDTSPALRPEGLIELLK